MIKCKEPVAIRIEQEQVIPRSGDGSMFIEQGSKILNDVRITEGPFFRSLSSGDMSLNDFRYTQEQFYFAVNYYSQPIAALFSRMSDARLRMLLLGNLLDEHGNINLDRCHSMTFKKFLGTIGCATDTTSSVKPNPAVQAFNLGLMGVCTQESQDLACACLAIIELAFSDISTLIAESVTDRGWVTPNDLAHYSLHAKLDVEHARILFEIAESVEHSSRQQIERGMQLGIYIFDQLYCGLYETALRR